MITQPRPHILSHPWHVWGLRRWQRGCQVLLLVLALTVSSGAAAAIPIPQGDAGIRLINRSSGKCLDVEWASPDDHALVQQFTCHGGSNQQWYLSKPYLGYYTMIVSRNSGKCLDVVGASRIDGAYVQQFTCHGGSNQQWLFQLDGQGYYYLVNQGSGMCLDIASPNGVNVVQKTCRGGWNQRWRSETQTQF